MLIAGWAFLSPHLLTVPERGDKPSLPFNGLGNEG